LKKERKKERKEGRKEAREGEREDGRRSIYVCFGGSVHELGDQQSLSGGDGGSRSSSMSAGISEPN
jgi:hypothetical protein